MRKLVLLAAFAATLLFSAFASTAGATYPITSVVFTGSSAAPTITVNGTGFGARPPRGTDNSVTSCGPYTNNGKVYANSLWFLDDTNEWQAGAGKPPNQNCIGVIVVSWTSTQVVLQFGSAYGSFAHWTADPGDNFVLKLKKFYFGGIVSYS
jgi:hypothetical protein